MSHRGEVGKTHSSAARSRAQRKGHGAPPRLARGTDRGAQRQPVGESFEAGYQGLAQATKLKSDMGVHVECLSPSRRGLEARSGGRQSQRLPRATAARAWKAQGAWLTLPAKQQTSQPSAQHSTSSHGRVSAVPAFLVLAEPHLSTDPEELLASLGCTRSVLQPVRRGKAVGVDPVSLGWDILERIVAII